MAALAAAPSLSWATLPHSFGSHPEMPSCHKARYLALWAPLRLLIGAEAQCQLALASHPAPLPSQPPQCALQHVCDGHFWGSTWMLVLPWYRIGPEIPKLYALEEFDCRTWISYHQTPLGCDGNVQNVLQKLWC